MKRSDCQCGVCAMLATATPTLHTHETQVAYVQCRQPGCVPPPPSSGGWLRAARNRAALPIGVTIA